ncbi:MAG: hypothetical protein QNL62_15475 [Gammaproteobacteria bacterium]|nr:hypothetical protein [Gammaproteobacteria bacterium]
MPEQNSISRSNINRAISWAGAILIVVLGVYLSNIRFMNSEWLSRAGCLVVMIGMWSGIGGIFQEHLLVTRTRWRRRNAIIRAKARLLEEQVDFEQSEKELAQVNDAFDKQLTEATHSLRLSIGILEVSLLMSGTFLWGFGDLFV